MLAVIDTLGQYAPHAIGATTMLLVGRWLLRADLVAGWIRVLGFIVIALGVGLLTGVLSLHPGEALDLVGTARHLWDMMQGAV